MRPGGVQFLHFRPFGISANGEAREGCDDELSTTRGSRMRCKEPVDTGRASLCPVVG